MATLAAATNPASSLPIRLQNFFARYPPQLYSAKSTGVKIPLTRTEAKKAAVARSEVDNDQTSTLRQVLTRSALAQPIIVTSSTTPSSTDSIPRPQQPDTQSQEEADVQPTNPYPTDPLPSNKFPPNPFLPHKNFVTGTWRGPKFGLRRQAELVKLAQQYHIEELLPPGKKSSVFKEQRLLEQGLRIKGVGEGQKVKGHIWERRMGSTLEKRRKAMENMPAMIREWKQKGHGRGWAKYPSSKASKN